MNAAASSLHWKLEPLAVELNEKVAELDETIPEGPAVIDVSGGPPVAGGIDTTNSTFKVHLSPTDNTGTYYWRIVFVPNSSFATGFTKCETSTVSINDSP